MFLNITNQKVNHEFSTNALYSNQNTSTTQVRSYPLLLQHQQESPLEETNGLEPNP